MGDSKCYMSAWSKNNSGWPLAHSIWLRLLRSSIPCWLALLAGAACASAAEGLCGRATAAAKQVQKLVNAASGFCS